VSYLCDKGSDHNEGYIKDGGCVLCTLQRVQIENDNMRKDRADWFPRLARLRADLAASASESARLRARLAEVEGAALRLCDEIAPTLSHVHDDAMVALRAVLSRTEGRTPEVKL
jgi:hypothetical protein